MFKSSPVQIGALTDWADVSASVFVGFCLAVKTNGTIWSWGVNGRGQLGHNNTANRSSPTQIGALTNWSKIATGGNYGFSVSAKTDGTLWSWGSNANGQLGDNTVADKSSPIQVGALTNWSKVAAGFTLSLSVKSDKTLWSWGAGTSGQLGDNTTIAKSSPVQIGSNAYWYEIAAGITQGVATGGINN